MANVEDQGDARAVTPGEDVVERALPDRLRASARARIREWHAQRINLDMRPEDLCQWEAADEIIRLRAALATPAAEATERAVDAVVASALKEADAELYKLIGSGKIAAAHVRRALTKAGYVITPAAEGAAGGPTVRELSEKLNEQTKLKELALELVAAKEAEIVSLRADGPSLDEDRRVLEDIRIKVGAVAAGLRWTDHKVIYLEPGCGHVTDERLWCEDDVWDGACSECGAPVLRYKLVGPVRAIQEKP